MSRQSQPMPVTRRSGHHGIDVTLDIPSLPDLPSTLLELAMKDLAIVEQSPQYRVDMTVFHRPERGLCSVCLAGAVLTRYLTPKDFCSHPEGMFDKDTACKLMAIDLMRTGHVRAAVRHMGHSAPGTLHNRPVVQYDYDPEQFRADMAQMVVDLKCVLL
jgi:hypothetical protein